MKGFELSVPIRLYWDLFPAPEQPPIDYDAVCRDILSLKILSLNLSDLGPQISPPCMTILQHLHGRGPAVSLALAPQACTPHLLPSLRDLGVRVLLARLSSRAELDAQRHLVANPDPQLPLGVWFEVTQSNWREIPEVIAWCADNGVRFLSFPMQRLTCAAPPFFFEPAEKQELSARLKDVAIPAELKLTIHDPFLWKLVYPSVPFPDGGCQAANTMVSISPDGAVYPCPSLPAILGNLAASSLREIIGSAVKKEMRRQILLHPAPCAGCGDFPTCRGGCRGRALAANGSLDTADPGCR